MHNRIACLLIASHSLLSGCIDNVLLADRTDGGASDAPIYTDGPTMDSPSSVCAACGGASSPDCLYAPGCGSVTRVCAANTCGDAVAIAHCGCDGRTFVSGCITPDRPYLHTGACTTVADGGAGPDVPPAATYCPADLYLPRAVVQPPPDTGVAFPSRAYEVRGRWIAPRRLATPLAVDCPASVAGDPACHPDAVIGVQPDGDAGPLEEWLTSVAFESLPSVTVGTEVVLRLQGEAGPSPGYIDSQRVTLILLRASDGAVLMVVADTARDAFYNGAAPFPFGDIGVQLSAAPVCIDRAALACGRASGVFAMEVLGVTGGRAVQPRETAVFGGTSGRYSFHNLMFTGVRWSGPPCADASPDTGPFNSYGFEIVRQPDL